MSEPLLVFLIVVYVAGFLGSGTWFIEGGDIEGHEVILWPLVLTKYLLKGLYKILFSGWK